MPIRFAEAIPIACLGLGVNIVSAWLLSGGEHHHPGHDHSHGHQHEHPHDEPEHRFQTGLGETLLEIFEAGVPPRFRLSFPKSSETVPPPSIETRRAGAGRQTFKMIDRGAFWESVEEIPEPHAFAVVVTLAGDEHKMDFEEHAHAHGDTHRDNNIRAAAIHVLADAAVSVFVILGLLCARTFGWLWMDPLAALIGACVIASWSYGLVRDTAAILVDVNPDTQLFTKIKREVEREGDQVDDLHLWRLGPGHIGVIMSVSTETGQNADDYRRRLARFPSLSHVTVEVHST